MRHTNILLLALASLLAASTGSAMAQTPAAESGFVAETPVERPWRTCPASPEKVARYYPQRAQMLNIEGTAVVQCKIKPDGHIHSCVWLSETTPDVGFGLTAEKLGCLFRFKMTGEEPASPMPIARIPIKFKLPR